MSIADALKPKHGSKHLSMIVNAEGKVVQAETREDEEQSVKQQEIIDLLYAAGYFRARIKGLSAFDKIVGGMTWCIDSCDVDIDVDLLFQENLTIGQKIALTEKIVMVLPKMKCPHRIEPHQIQGLDFIHIYPVIQWLVKHSMERRKEMGDFFRSYAVKQFEKMYSQPEVEAQKAFCQKAQLNLKNVQEKFRPQRNFRRTGDPPTNILERVESTLFEYGHFPSVPVTSGPDGQAEVTQVDEDRSRRLMTSMASLPEQEVRVGAGVVGSIVSLQADEIARAVEHYTELQAQVELSETNQLQRLKIKETALIEEKQRLDQKLQEESDRLERIQDSSNEDSPSHMLTEAEQGILKKLQSLVTTSETLKQQELEFREQCKTELATLQQLIKEAEETEAPDTDSEESEKAMEQLTRSVAATRVALARQTRAVAALQRQLDQVPSRAELAQYQRRFMELYSQVSAKHRETKQFFTLYNTLNDKHSFLSKELGLLSSISDNYNEAMASQASKEQFVEQLEGILQGIEVSKAKVKKKLLEERDQRERLSNVRSELIEQARQCVAAYKQASLEAANNENLLNKLRNLTLSQG
ncbi:coiled-coil domain-containing protein 93 isoform X1 [Macrosteles quadrilineatus]|uniref:coiled-coil domain-containing protein 93 isoform X1 n=1 Tax=Macrosteles quadrilineatus TaxID=74068 RepID=UPI0023E12A75|nr:coiled-coil domain-containing protein 93 isoform X1 [Macrosteles quadrilineatus]